MKTGWRAPSKIALVKYWGKRAGQMPENGSLSMTLDLASTTTFLTFTKNRETGRPVEMEYFFHGERHEKFARKIEVLLTSLLPEFPFLADYKLAFHSENSFPHSAGIASSASSMAALALCLVSMEESVMNRKFAPEAFFRRASFIARLGSGSASRSIYGGLVGWGETDWIPGSSDEYATPVTLEPGSRFRQLRDLILLVSPEEKEVSSSAGHALMADHPYREGRKLQASQNLYEMGTAIRENDFREFARLAENEALSLHALLLSSHPGIVLLKPDTLRIIGEIRKFRAGTGLDLFFTIDAGPNVHLLYFEDQRERVLPFAGDILAPYCHEGRWLDDRMGAGPQLLMQPTEI